MFDFAKSRYHNDPAFKALVDMMTHAIISNEFTPSEMRSAAIMASINYEMMRTDHRQPRYYIDKETEEAFATLQMTWDREAMGRPSTTIGAMVDKSQATEMAQHLRPMTYYREVSDETL